MILFLNKVDLFREKMARIPYRVVGERNDDFKGPYYGDKGVGLEEAIEAATDHTLSLFVNVRRDMTKEIYHHVTCALDTSQIIVVFNAVKNIILRNNLTDSGFMQ